MKNVLVALIVLAFAIPALAGQNPDIGIYLYTTSTGIGGTNHLAAPAEGAYKSLYVLLDHFGVGGGVYGVAWMFEEVNCPNYLSFANYLGGQTLLTDEIVGPAAGVAVTSGADPKYPDANGVVLVARVRYETPGEELRADGYIRFIPHLVDGRAVADANNELDFWCIHSVEYDGLSGNFGWDNGEIPDGDCAPNAVQSTTWGSIKALYR